jgi:acetyltransferase-like isoleucine patch superfamily enzyme
MFEKEAIRNLMIHWPSLLRGLVYRLIAPIGFRSVDAGCRIESGVRFGRLMTNASLGNGTVIKHGVYFQTGSKSRISVGANCLINAGCHLVASESIAIGERTSIAEYVSIRDQEHVHRPGEGVKGGDFTVSPVSIGKNVWIGRGVYIGPGTQIGDDCVVGANSVVKGTFPQGVLIAGAPATIKRVIS